MLTNQLSELLETIQVSTNCIYLSDLHNAQHRAKVVEFLQTMDGSDYPPEIWSHVVSYITQTENNCQSLDEAIKYIINA